MYNTTSIIIYFFFHKYTLARSSRYVSVTVLKSGLFPDINLVIDKSCYAFNFQKVSVMHPQIQNMVVALFVMSGNNQQNLTTCSKLRTISKGNCIQYTCLLVNDAIYCAQYIS